jgi:preprotein translocase subunit SecG
MLNTFLTIIFVLISVLMVFIVLLQRGRGGGLVGAFGAGGGGSAFGTKTGDVFTAATVIIFVVFLLLAFILNWRVGSTSPATPTAAAAPQKTPAAGHGVALPASKTAVQSAKNKAVVSAGKPVGGLSVKHSAALPKKTTTAKP